MLLWTPPHFWALALLLSRHYEAADVPMMPVVRGASATSVRVLLYTRGAGGGARWCPPRSAPSARAIWSPRSCSAAVFCALAWRLWRVQSPARAAVLFHYSLLYLSLLFLAVAVDAVIR